MERIDQAEPRRMVEQEIKVWKNYYILAMEKVTLAYFLQYKKHVNELSWYGESAKYYIQN